jgi:hypothetical protein
MENKSFFLVFFVLFPLMIDVASPANCNSIISDAITYLTTPDPANKRTI